MSKRTHSFNAFETTLDANLVADPAQGDISVANVGSIHDDTYLVIDPEDANLREYVKVINVNVGAETFENCERGLEGSAGGVAVAHKAGATVRAVAVHQWLDDIFDDIEKLEDWDLDHDDNSDQHPRYLDKTGAGSAEELYVKLTTKAVDGPQVLSGPINLQGYLDMKKSSGTPETNPNKIVNMGRPDQPDDAATKEYVDDMDKEVIVQVTKDFVPVTGGKITGSLNVNGGLYNPGMGDAHSMYLPNMYVDHRGKLWRTRTGVAAKDHTHAATDLSNVAAKDHTHAADPIVDLPFEQHSAGGAFRVGSVDNWRETILTPVLTKKITLPPGTWTVVVSSDGQFATLGPAGSGARLFVKARVNINGNKAAYNKSPAIGEGEHFQPIATHAVAGLSGEVTLEVQYSVGDYTGSGVFGALRFVEATWQAFKTGR